MGSYVEGQFLIAACRMGQVEEVKECLRRCPWLLHQELADRRRTPLMEAALANQIEVAKALLEHDPMQNVVWDRAGSQMPRAEGMNAIDASQCTALGLACMAGHMEMVRLLIEHGAQAVANWRGLAVGDPIVPACQVGQVAAIRLLWSTFEVLRTPTFWQCHFDIACHNGHEALARLLLEEGPHPPSVPNLAYPFKSAAGQGHMGLVRMLLAMMAGMDVNHLISILTQALCEANKGRREEVMQLLVEHGADMHVKRDARGRSPFAAHWAAPRQGGAYIYLCENYGKAPVKERGDLVKHAKNGNITALEAILGHLDPEARRLKLRGRDQLGHTPLTVAVEKGNEAMVGRLLEWGAEVDVANRDGMTPLKLAARMGRPDLVRRLCAAGAVMRDLDTKECKEFCVQNHTYDALPEAVGHLETFTTLLEMGAPTQGRGVEMAFRAVCTKGDLPALRELTEHTPWSGFQCKDATFLEAIRRRQQDVVVELLAVGGAAKTVGWSYWLGIMETRARELTRDCPLALKLARRNDLYMLHKARTIHDANSPQAALPPCLAHRAQPPQEPLPTVTVAEPTMPSESKRGASSDGGQGPRMEVVAATAAFVVQHLTRDLYQELMLLLLPGIPALAVPPSTHRDDYVYDEKRGIYRVVDDEEEEDGFSDDGRIESDGHGY